MNTFKMNTFCRNNISDLAWKKESSHYNTSYACVNKTIFAVRKHQEGNMFKEKSRNKIVSFGWQM